MHSARWLARVICGVLVACMWLLSSRIVSSDAKDACATDVCAVPAPLGQLELRLAPAADGGCECAAPVSDLHNYCIQHSVTANECFSLFMDLLRMLKKASSPCAWPCRMHGRTASDGAQTCSSRQREVLQRTHEQMASVGDGFLGVDRTVNRSASPMLSANTS